MRISVILALFVLGRSYEVLRGRPRRAQSRLNLHKASEEFDIELAVALGGYSFEVYNNPPVGKVSVGLDCTTVSFHSTSFVRSATSGVLLGTLQGASFNGAETKEEQFAERLLTGSNPDPYFIIHTKSSDGINIERTMDSFVSSCKSNNLNPSYKENFQLYARSNVSLKNVDSEFDLSNNILVLKAYDRDILRWEGWKSTFGSDYYSGVEEECIGEGTLNLGLLGMQTDEKSFDVPLYRPLDDSAAKKQTKLGILIRGVLSRGNESKRKRVGTVNVGLQFVPWLLPRSSARNTSSIPNKQASPTLIKGATAGVIWQTLLKRLKEEKRGKHIISKNMQHICSLENKRTDTQCGVWADMDDKTCVVSFRGTEQIKLRDVLTDINLLQVEYNTASLTATPFDINAGEDSSKSTLKHEGKVVLVHRGFYAAFRSIQPALLQVISDLLQCEKHWTREWSILVTGHSLGGALATLLSFELARIQKDLVVTGEDSSKDSKNALKCASITCYTFGAPRVGNKAFSTLSNKLLSNHYRLINDKDVVPRVPRSSKLMSVPTSVEQIKSIIDSSVIQGLGNSGIDRFNFVGYGAQISYKNASPDFLQYGNCTETQLEFEHSGKCVFISENTGTNTEARLCWIEGENNNPPPIPLRDNSPFFSSAVQVNTTKNERPKEFSSSESTVQNTTIDKNSLMNISSEALSLQSLFCNAVSSTNLGKGEAPGRLEKNEVLLQYERLISLARQLDNSLGSFEIDLSLLGDSYNSAVAKLESTSIKDSANSAISAIGDLNADELLNKLTSSLQEWDPILDPEFVEQELSMLQSLVDKRAIEHHLEPAYFKSLEAVLNDHHKRQKSSE